MVIHLDDSIRDCQMFEAVIYARWRVAPEVPSVEEQTLACHCLFCVEELRNQEHIDTKAILEET